MTRVTFKVFKFNDRFKIAIKKLIKLKTSRMLSKKKSFNGFLKFENDFFSRRIPRNAIVNNPPMRMRLNVCRHIKSENISLDFLEKLVSLSLMIQVPLHST